MNYETSNKSATITWEDEDAVNSWVPAMAWYGLQCLKWTEVGTYATELVVYGPTEKVDEFLADLDEGRVQPLESLSLANECDEDYQEALQKAIEEAA